MAGLSRFGQSFFIDWMWVRAALVAFCLATGYFLWLLAFHRLRPGSPDLLPITALSFGTFGAILGLLRWLAVPSPTIRIHQAARVGDSFLILQLAVANVDLPRYLRPLVQRTAPEGCEIRMRYREFETGSSVFGVDRVIGRWNTNPEPINYSTGELRLEVMLQNRRLPKMSPCEAGDPDGEYTVPVAVKEDGREDCHHFNDESYQPSFQPGWRNPSWRIPKGTYRLEVEVTGHGMIRPSRFICRLVNSGSTPEGFGLAEA